MDGWIIRTWMGSVETDDQRGIVWGEWREVESRRASDVKDEDCRFESISKHLWLWETS